RRRENTVAWIVHARVNEAADSYVPKRICRQRVGQMAEGHRRHVRMLTLSCDERRYSRRRLTIDPVLIMQASNQLQIGLDLPGELPETLVLFVDSWELGVGAGLAVVIAQVLISRKEPKPVANHRTAEICREVTVLDALISAGRCTTGNGEQDWLAGQA